MYLRQGKLLLAVQAAKKAQQLAGAADPSVHSMVARLAAAVLAATSAPAGAAAAGAQAAPAALPSLALEVAQQETAALLGVGAGGKLTPAAATAYQQQWAKAHTIRSVRHAAAAAETAPAGAERKEAAQRVLAAQWIKIDSSSRATHADCVAVHELLSSKLQLPEAAASWRQQCSQAFSWSAVFDGAARVSVPAPWEEEAKAKEAAAAAAGGEDAATAAAGVNGIADKAAALALS